MSHKPVKMLLIPYECKTKNIRHPKTRLLTPILLSTPSKPLKKLCGIIFVATTGVLKNFDTHQASSMKPITVLLTSVFGSC